MDYYDQLKELGRIRDRMTIANNTFPEQWRDLARRYERAGMPANAEACRKRADRISKAAREAQA